MVKKAGAVPDGPQDTVVVEDLYDAYGASCYQLAHRMVGEEQLACTIVRDVFLAVWSRETVFDPSRGSVQTWLLGATHRSAVLALRCQRLLRSGGEVSVEIFAAQPKIGTVRRYALELAYFGGYTDTEVAALTGSTVGMVKSLTVQALRGMGTRPSTLAARHSLSPSH